MPSVANIIGTDLSLYKLINNNQFACNPMHVGRDDRIPIALYTENEPSIVSPAYFVFEIIDTNVLIPKYAMLWFSRLEFDRECWFHTDSTVRGSITWDELNEITIPVPDKDKQQAIVEAYEAIERRIVLKRKINDNLEAQSNAVLQDKIALNGKESTVDNILTLFDSMRRPMSNLERNGMERNYPYYGAASLMDYVQDYIFDGIFGLIGEDGTVIDKNGYPTMQYVWGKFWVNNHAHIFQGKNSFSTECVYLLLKHTVIQDIVTGAVQLKVNQENLRNIPLLVPSDDDLKEVECVIQPIFFSIRQNRDEIERLEQVLSILLARLSDSSR